MVDRGYDDRPVKELTDAELAEQALQSDYDSGYYAAKPGDHLYARLGQVAIDRRNECFAEIKRRLEATEALVRAAEALLEEHGWYHPELPEDGQGSCAACCSTRAALRPFQQEATDGN